VRWIWGRRRSGGIGWGGCEDPGAELVEVVQAVGGMGYAAAAQGVRRFWKRGGEHPEMEEFANRLRGALGR
jgi:hypothetical protein